MSMALLALIDGGGWGRENIWELDPCLEIHTLIENGWDISNFIYMYIVGSNYLYRTFQLYIYIYPLCDE